MRLMSYYVLSTPVATNLALLPKASYRHVSSQYPLRLMKRRIPTEQLQFNLELRLVIYQYMLNSKLCNLTDTLGMEDFRSSTASTALAGGSLNLGEAGAILRSG